MIDAYVHLDGTAADPLAGIRSRMHVAGVRSALAVEMWNGQARHLLERDPELLIALCYRDQTDAELRAMLAGPLAQSGRWLMPHAESGIEPLAQYLLKLLRPHPQFRIYVPHLCWPRREGIDGPAWPSALESLSEVPGLIVGVSVLAYFSREEFPHPDVRLLIEPLLLRFGPARLVGGTDNPLFEKSRYRDYITFVGQWVRSVWPDWRDPDALLT